MLFKHENGQEIELPEDLAGLAERNGFKPVEEKKKKAAEDK